MKILGRYQNGNTLTTIYEDGTRVRYTQDDEFEFDFPENMDIKITNCCDMECPYCHEGSTKYGKAADIMNAKFIETLHPYQEVAIGGGDVTTHPDLIPFLKKLRSMRVIPNITVNQVHFLKHLNLIRELVDEQLVFGIGVSLVAPTDELFKALEEFPNAVVHVIAGVLTPSQIESLANHNIKMLVLGYKSIRRGTINRIFYGEEIDRNIKWLKENLLSYRDSFRVISFDNLALEQLDIKSQIPKEQWEEFYGGDEGTSTYFIDMVENVYAQNSTAPFNKRFEILPNMTVKEMFDNIRKMKIRGEI